MAAQAPAAAVTPAGGTVRIGLLRGGTYEVASLPMEVYVARVLAGEAAPQSAPAALEALAIAIRTYTVTNHARHSADGFDLCDQTHCQVLRTSTLLTERAALATAEQILLHNGRPATVFYSASCGGRSEKPSNVWPGADDPPYLSAHDDDGCGGFPTWSTELALADLERAFIGGGFKGTLRDVRILSRNDAGRVARLALDGLRPREISGQDLRMVVGRSLGFQHIQSTSFELRQSGRSFRFTGRGAGHGVGLCVIGSMKLAAKGQSAAQILARYFPGTRIGAYGARLTSAPPEQPVIAAPPSSTRRPGAEAPVNAAAPRADVPRVAPVADVTPVPPGDVDVVLPPAEAAERHAVAVMIERERQVLAQRLGVEPARVRIRFHESDAAYELATGQPWFTFGAHAGGDIQLVTLRSLRERGMLERTLRRQLVHLMVDPLLPQRPAWIREGAAIHFADPDAPNSASASCPQDSELQRPLSLGALGDAYSRARACFERQIRGRDWRRVR